MVRSIMRFVLLITVIVVLLGGSRAWAGGSSPNVVVYTSTGQPNGGYLTTFAPDGTSAGKIAVPDASRVNVSPSLQWYSTVVPFEHPKLQYAPLSHFTPGLLVDVNTEPGFDIGDAQFNWDSAYLLYVLTKLDAPQYIIGIIELQTGKQVEFAGTYSQAPAPTKTEFGGAAGPLFLDAQSGRLVLRPFAPNAGGSSEGLYETYIGNFASLKAGRYPLPPVGQIATADQYGIYGSPQHLSPAPEGLKYLAYFSKNAGNPPANYQEAPFSQQYNVLNILDLTVGQSVVAAQAGKGQGLEQLAWAPFNPVATPPGDKIYFSGGNYQNTSFISQPRLYTFQVSTNTVIEGPLLTNDPAEDITAIVVCTNTTQDTLYFVGTKTDSATQNSTATLYVAPLYDISQKKALVSGSFVGLSGCVPPVS